MPFVSILRVTKYAFQNFGRNVWLSIVTIVVLALTLFMISIISTLNLIADNAITTVKERVDIDVFFKPDVAETSVFETKKFLEDMPEVKEVGYISKGQALEKYRQDHADDSDIQASLNELEENPLPASLVVKAQDLNQYSDILVRLDNSEFNDLIETRNFESNQNVIQQLSNITDRVSNVGVVVSAVFVLIAILVVFNTIRITIYTYRTELGIMKLVGATNAFIRMPFLIESVLYALIATILTFAVFYPLLVAVSPYITHFFEGYDFDALLYFQQNFVRIAAIELLVAVVLSMLSSSVAIGRYLKV
ncbi:MAG: ABC transporter permease [Candidatus Kerfeldbacteria bacterium]|nr:ABC transporter permease [Candidatus Kerfeldbacteria bacterium]